MTKQDNPYYFLALDRYWKAANYLSVGQLYLLDNPLLQEPLKPKHIKKKIVGHWGTVPGQNFIYAHCNRVVDKFNQQMIIISGPGHGGNFFIANSYLEGTYTKFYPSITQDKSGMQKLFKQFSFPGGVSSHVAPETPGSMHEGGELGYSLSHAFGAVFDNPDLIATCIIGDGEAETGALASAWHCNKFLNARFDGAVLPILHLNGFKISNPTVLSRLTKQELSSLLYGYGWNPIFVDSEQNDTIELHRKMASAMDKAINDIHYFQNKIRKERLNSRPYWPMIVLTTPKGWTCPKVVDGKKIEDSFNAHQVPISMTEPHHIRLLEEWLRSYEPEELFDEDGRPARDIRAIIPAEHLRISANPVTNGGINTHDLNLPNLLECGLTFDTPASIKAQDTEELGKYLAKVFKLNEKEKNFRLFCPDEAKSNRLTPVFEVEKRMFNMPIYHGDEYMSDEGRVMDSYLNEHCCEGWLEGYTLTGRHGIFASYEAFARVVDSMISQHIKWLTMCKKINWRKSIPSLNLLLTSNVWQQDHNGFTHQDPGLIDHICDKKGEIGRVYLPADANTLIACTHNCLQTKDCVNAIIASKHPTHQWLTMEQAIEHCNKGLSVWDFASHNPEKADLILACCGATPTIEIIALSKLLKEKLPYLNFKVVNIVDLMRIQNENEHPHSLTDNEYNKIFNPDIPTIFAYHGYPKLIHELCYKRANAQNLHVAGYREEGAITTAFDMRVLNKTDRFNLFKMVLKFVPKIKTNDKNIIEQELDEKLIEHKKYITKYGVDLPEIDKWEL